MTRKSGSLKVKHKGMCVSQEFCTLYFVCFILSVVWVLYIPSFHVCYFSAIFYLCYLLCLLFWTFYKLYIKSSLFILLQSQIYLGPLFNITCMTQSSTHRQSCVHGQLNELLQTFLWKELTLPCEYLCLLMTY